MLYPYRVHPLGPTEQKRPPPSSPPPHAGCPILAISLVGMITTAVLLLSYYVFVIKCCLNWHHPDTIRRLSRSRGRWRDTSDRVLSSLYPSTAADRGLDQSSIQAIPTLKFKRGERRNPLQECAVCLNEFRDEERVRMLPNCLHVFHIDCIDTWLQTHANCPLCRAGITKSTSPVPAAEPSVVIDVRDEENGQTPRNDQASGNTGANSPATGTSDAGVGRRRRLQHKVSSLGDECIDLRGKDENFAVQPIRRSFSMGSSADGQLYMAVQEMLKQNPHFQQVNDGEGTSTTSTSWKTRRLTFFSLGGHCRNLRNSVLPIQNEQ